MNARNEPPRRGEHPHGDGTPSPALLRAAAATQRAWEQLAAGWGLLTEEDVQTVLRAAGPGTTAEVNPWDAADALMRVRLDGAWRYPGFQFDPATGSPRPWVSPLLKLASQRSRSPEGVILWFLRPTTYLGSAKQRPIDHLDDPGLLLDIAHKTWDGEW